MKEKISLFLPWIIVGLTAGIFIFLFISKLIPGMQAFAYVITTPAMTLLQYTTTHSITVFGGGGFTLAPFMQAGLIAAAGLIVLLAVAPFLLAKGYRTVRAETLHKRPPVWYLGAVLLVTSLGFSLFNSATMTYVYFTQNSHITDNVLKDQLRSQLMMHGFAAAEKMLMPHQYGGGNGSFINIHDGDSAREIRLTDLKTWNENSEFSFEIQDSVTDSTLTIIGTLAESADQSTNRSSFYAVRVTPQQSSTIRMLPEGVVR
jgi:hypothetical protein